MTADLLALWTTQQAAARLSLSAGTLRNWRSRCPDRLPHVKLGRAVRYDQQVVLAFIARSGSQHTQSRKSSTRTRR